MAIRENDLVPGSTTAYTFLRGCFAVGRTDRSQDGVKKYYSLMSTCKRPLTSQFDPKLIVASRFFSRSRITETPDTKGKTSKTELLFVAKPNNSYTKPSTRNDTNLSPIILEERRFIPVVNKFCYLGSIINHDLRESEDVDNRTKKTSQAFGDLRRGVFTSKSTSFIVKKAVYISLIL